MNFKIWIGVDRLGTPLIGAAAVNAALDRGELHDTEHVYSSQLRYRIVVFYAEPHSDRTGIAPSSVRGGTSREVRGSWSIQTRTTVREQLACGVDVRGYGNPDHEFPTADHARSIRRKVQP